MAVADFGDLPVEIGIQIRGYRHALADFNHRPSRKPMLAQIHESVSVFDLLSRFGAHGIQGPAPNHEQDA
ncbi:MAG: hypothetical protein OXL33_02325 [Chloroflexota bacterium]|nr:hypothetical protein [Chloroflexota bacterium]